MFTHRSIPSLLVFYSKSSTAILREQATSRLVLKGFIAMDFVSIFFKKVYFGSSLMGFDLLVLSDV